MSVTARSRVTSVMAQEEALGRSQGPASPPQVRVGRSDVSLRGHIVRCWRGNVGALLTLLDFSGETASLLDSFLKPRLV